VSDNFTVKKVDPLQIEFIKEMSFGFPLMFHLFYSFNPDV